MGDSTGKWVCSVCGYVHNGLEAPDFCPVCGATKDLFEPMEEPASTRAGSGAGKTAAPLKWRCLNCEFIHDGESAPEFCPVCAAPAERFEPYAEEAGSSNTSGEKTRILIVGGGIAGVSAADGARKTSPDAEIRLVVREPQLPYYRLNLTRFLAGEIDETQLPLHPDGWYEENNIELIKGGDLKEIDRAGRIAVFKDADDLIYDKLILTIGSHPFVPPFKGARLDNVTVLRTRGDADFILGQCSEGKKAVIIGGGLLGLETAGALAGRKVDVTLLEGFGYLLPRQLNEKGARILEDHVASLGIKLKNEARTKEIVGEGKVEAVLLESGENIPADIVVIATGIRSNSYIARLAGLEVDRGVIVNNRLQTSDSDIFAAGDVAEHIGVSYGTWGPSQFQGTIAGINAAGGDAEFAGIPRSNMLKVLGYDMFSIGRFSAEDASYREVDDLKGKDYCYFLFRDSHLVGAILLGNTKLSSQVKNAIEKKTDFSGLLAEGPDACEVLDFLGS